MANEALIATVPRITVPRLAIIDSRNQVEMKLGTERMSTYIRIHARRSYSEKGENTVAV